MLEDTMDLYKNFDFNEQNKFLSTNRLCEKRSSDYKVKCSERSSGVWSIKPPDFRPQMYNPKPQKKCLIRSPNHPKQTPKSSPNMDVGDKKIHLIKLVHDFHKNSNESPKFIAKFRMDDDLDIKLKKVKEGIFKTGPYSNPVPHDYRQVYANTDFIAAEDFMTSFPKDLCNLKFHSQRLYTLNDNIYKNPKCDSSGGNYLLTNLKQPPKWEISSFLPKSKYPNMFNGFTRYYPDVEPRRSADEALLDRVIAKHMLKT